ncbi:hypothetical protein AcV5_009932 [Taiwanofungus camphoratus]|nr:hypothetical protein AcV5_009932 [Antrodia cinnamomea]
MPALQLARPPPEALHHRLLVYLGLVPGHRHHDLLARVRERRRAVERLPDRCLRLVHVEAVKVKVRPRPAARGAVGVVHRLEHGGEHPAASNGRFGGALQQTGPFKSAKVVSVRRVRTPQSTATAPVLSEAGVMDSSWTMQSEDVFEPSPAARQQKVIDRSVQQAPSAKYCRIGP